MSVGHELLTNPSVIFLDECTSGLDSTNALKLMQTLSTLAAGGRTIVTSIHQPSGRLYLEMNKVCVLCFLSLAFLLWMAHASALHLSGWLRRKAKKPFCFHANRFPAPSCCVWHLDLPCTCPVD